MRRCARTLRHPVLDSSTSVTPVCDKNACVCPHCGRYPYRLCLHFVYPCLFPPPNMYNGNPRGSHCYNECNLVLLINYCCCFLPMHLSHKLFLHSRLYMKEHCTLSFSYLSHFPCWLRTLPSFH